ncbi:uncharacterized protein LOC117175599 [Belonocnema kinseyi]|uniref:uncharacterized protein LOC117175599 n=1 Tax=Belonocnema kinseyi TaxID=2817044 RepID=UPI00143DA985|nr:uncharacterized protein LOC117175599 [Belonocnema kinseyi]
MDGTEDRSHQSRSQDKEHHISQGPKHLSVRPWQATIYEIDEKMDKALCILEDDRNLGRAVASDSNRNLPMFPEMPFLTLAEFEAFDSEISKDNFQLRKFIETLKKIGGDTIKEAARLAVRLILTDQLSQAISWTGRSLRVGNELEFRAKVTGQTIRRLVSMGE